MSIDTKETNAEQLRKIMALHNLKAKHIAKLIDVSISLVRAWLVHEGSAKYRKMKDRDLDYLKCKIVLTVSKMSIIEYCEWRDSKNKEN